MNPKILILIGVFLILIFPAYGFQFWVGNSEKLNKMPTFGSFVNTHNYNFQRQIYPKSLAHASPYRYLGNSAPGFSNHPAYTKYQNPYFDNQNSRIIGGFTQNTQGIGYFSTRNSYGYDDRGFGPSGNYNLRETVWNLNTFNRPYVTNTRVFDTWKYESR